MKYTHFPQLMQMKKRSIRDFYVWAFNKIKLKKQEETTTASETRFLVFFLS